MDYSEKLKDPRWQKKRLEVFQRDEFKCVLCSDAKLNLHVHHESYSQDPWDTSIDDLKTLCCNCHKFITFFHIKILSEIIKHEIICNSTDSYTCLFISVFSDGKIFLYQDSSSIEPRYSIINDPIFLIQKIHKINGTS